MHGVRVWRRVDAVDMMLELLRYGFDYEAVRPAIERGEIVKWGDDWFCRAEALSK